MDISGVSGGDPYKVFVDAVEQSEGDDAVQNAAKALLESPEVLEEHVVDLFGRLSRMPHEEGAMKALAERVSALVGEDLTVEERESLPKFDLEVLKKRLAALKEPLQPEASSYDSKALFAKALGFSQFLPAVKAGLTATGLSTISQWIPDMGPGSMGVARATAGVGNMLALAAAEEGYDLALKRLDRKIAELPEDAEEKGVLQQRRTQMGAAREVSIGSAAALASISSVEAAKSLSSEPTLDVLSRVSSAAGAAFSARRASLSEEQMAAMDSLLDEALAELDEAAASATPEEREFYEAFKLHLDLQREEIGFRLLTGEMERQAQTGATAAHLGGLFFKPLSYLGLALNIGAPILFSGVNLIYSHREQLDVETFLFPDDERESSLAEKRDVLLEKLADKDMEWARPFAEKSGLKFEATEREGRLKLLQTLIGM